MALMMWRLVREEVGQDPVEYVLLLAFVCMCSAALLITQGESIAAIWHVTNNNLVAGCAAAS